MFRSDLIIEAESLEAGAYTGEKYNNAVEIEGVEVKESWNEKHTIKLTTVKIHTESGARAMDRPLGTYITIEIPTLLMEEEEVKEAAEEELGQQLRNLLSEIHAQHMMVVGLGNREVTADAVGPYTVDQLMITRHLFETVQNKREFQRKYRMVSAGAPGVMAQTGMETGELIQGIAEEIHPDVIVVVDALAARNPKRLNTTIQLTNTGICPGAGVGNDRKELNEKSMGCPVFAIGVPTVMDAVSIARREITDEVSQFFVMPRNIDSAVQYVSEILSGGINRVNKKQEEGLV